MNVLTRGISFVDLNFQGRPRTIASAVMQATSGIVIVDPGPSTCLAALRRGLEALGARLDDVTALLLTHIHLDHAGATGTLVAENPKLRVYVHEKGAPHLVNPEKLLASAKRLYGDDMERLWGEVRPVPEAAVVSLQGGERIDAGNRTWDVAYTPGHASHHVSYFSADTGIAFVGDTAGVKVLPQGPVIAPTPPPDIDIEQWHASLRLIDAWRPEILFLTHFGPWSPSGRHLSEAGEQLDKSAALVRMLLEQNADEETSKARFVKEMNRTVRRRLADDDARTYDAAARFDLSWMGLVRYWRKKR